MKRTIQKTDDKTGVQNEGSDTLEEKSEQNSEKPEENVIEEDQNNVNEEVFKKPEDEEINTGDVGESYEVSTMIGYVNNSEIADVKKRLMKV